MSHVRLSGLLLVVCSTLAFGQPAVDQARQLLGDGEFARALKVVDTALPATKDAKAAARLLLVRGQCLLALGQGERASAAFSAALKKDLASELDEATASPQAIELLEKARAALPALVSIAVLNGEATVRVDDKPVGPAPLTLELPGGSHVIEASARDGRSAKSAVEVQPGRRLEVNLLLERSAPVVVVTPPAPPPPEQTAPVSPPEPVTAPAPAPTLPRTTAPPAPVTTAPTAAAPVTTAPAPAAPSPAITVGPAPVTAPPVTSPAPTATAPPAAVTAPPGQPSVSASAVERPRSKIGWVPLTTGALLAGAGGVSLWQANVRYTLLTSRSTLTAAQERDAVQNGPLLQTLGWVGVGLGAAAVVTGVVLLALPPEAGPTVSALVTPHGAFVGVSGRLP